MLFALHGRDRRFVVETMNEQAPNSYKRIVIAEDHTIVREGLKALLSSHPELRVVGEAQDGREAVRYAGQLKPDLILMDLSMPRMTGMEAIREVKRISPVTKVLVLTVHKTEEYVSASLEAGADGYVLKDTRNSSWLQNVLPANVISAPPSKGHRRLSRGQERFETASPGAR
ncbi:MAG: Protein-glutamate methylesterase/protein-glutamine glutaminase [Syntrophus sp. SKADARSKE-3]|nr:Protein-glutamate methylesterase/protein-glutamine glutaminase [Syntrophus sp. SKADARSKE-3]